MFIRDAASVAERQVTPEGFLHVHARIGRTGVHEYRAEELGSPAGFPPGTLVRVLRPPEEVFAPASMASFRGKPVTDGHPPTMVDARNWRRYAIGHAGHDLAPEDTHLCADLVIGDAAAAERALAGAELSSGYFADFDFEPGVTPEGEPYDAVQRNIRGNHVALVDVGRCGATCRVGDAVVADCGCDACACASTGSPADGTPAQVPQTAAAPADDLAAELAELRGRLAAVQADHRQAIGAKDELLVGLEARLSDEAEVEARVAARCAVIDAARRVLGQGFAPAGRSDDEIRRLVVGHVLGPERLAGRGDAYVAAAFETLLASSRGGHARSAANPLAAHLASAFDAAPTSRSALAARNRHLTHAWKGVTTEGAF